MSLLAKIMNDETLPHDGVPLPSSVTQATMASQADGLQEERIESSVQEAREIKESGRDSASIVAIIDQPRLPSRREIAAAIIENSKARAHQLIAGETLDLAHPFSVFSWLEIKKINVRHEKGSVTLNVSEAMSQEDGRILPPKTTEHELAIVRRSDGAWVISDPQERTYLPEKDALETFERQAEISLRQAPNSSSARLAVKALDRLYDQQGAAQRAAIR